MSNTHQRLTSLCSGLAIIALATLNLGFAPAPAPSGSTMLVAVWDADGAPLDGASVTATNGLDGVKAIPQSNGMYMLDGAGFQYGDLVKASIDVQHPSWGSDSVDMLFTVAPILRLELVFTGSGEVDAYSPQATSGPVSGPGDGTPANDDCANAEAVEVGVPASGSTAGGTVDAVDTCGTSVSAPGVWHSVIGTGNTMTVSTCNENSGYDTKLSVFCGGCDALNCIGGNDDSCVGASSLLSTFSWCSQLGAEYLILVHGFSSDAGPYSLLVSDDGVPCDTAVACLPAGACCFTDGSCDQLTANECAAAGGTYSGDGVPCFESSGSSSYGSAPNAAIPDFDLNGLSDSLVISDSMAAGDVDVELFIDHTWQGDLIVTLTHEDTGTSATIVDRNGFPELPFGCGEDNFVGVVLDDEGASSIDAQCAPNLSSPPNFTSFPDALAAFDGEDIQGTWTLNVSDNAEFDTGTLVSWSMTVSEAETPTCAPPECFLVIGDGFGSATFVGADHEFETQVGPVIEDSYPVLMSDIPSFVLPPVAKRSTGASATISGPSGSNLEPWMQDGKFAVQVVMWNPNVFPWLPEQFTACLDVEILPNGKVKTTPGGEDLGGLELTAKIDRLPDGTRVISFPFVIPGF